MRPFLEGEIPATVEQNARMCGTDAGGWSMREVDGRRYRVRLWVPDYAGAGREATGGGGGGGGTRGSSARGGSRRRGASSGSPIVAGDGRITVPMQGTIVKVLVSEGDLIEAGQTICILEAMKMENPINTDRAGSVTELRVKPGDALGAGDVVAVIS